MPSPTYSVAKLMSDLRSTVGVTLNDTILLLGYNAVNDGGEGEFYWVPTSALADDGGAVIQPTLVTGNGRWLRVFTNSIISVKFWGAIGNGSADDTNAINNAFIYAGKGIIDFPHGDYCVTGIKIPINISIRGCGNDVTKAHRTTIIYTPTSGTCIEFQSSYSTVSGITILYSGASTDKVTGIGYYTGTSGSDTGITRTSLYQVTINGFDVGITNIKTATTFGHYHDQVNLVNCNVGVWLVKVNNVVFSRCYFQSCGDGIILNTFVSVVFDSGCVFELFGPGSGQPRERIDSKLFIVTNGYALTIRDFYCEVASRLTVENSQQFAQFKKVRALVITGGTITRPVAKMDFPVIQFMDAFSAGVQIQYNNLPKGGQITGTTENLVDGLDPSVDGGVSRNTVFGMDINNNALPTKLNEKPAMGLALYKLVSGVSTALTGVTFSNATTFCTSSGGLTTVYIEFTVVSTGTLDSSPLQIGVPTPMFEDTANTSDASQVSAPYTSNLLMHSPFSNTIARIQHASDKISLYTGFNTPLPCNELQTNSYLLVQIQYPSRRQKSIPVTPTTDSVTVSAIASGTATLTSQVTTDGGSTLSACGFCWSTSPNPTTADSTAPCAAVEGPMTSNITGLGAATVYYVRAYATNALGTDYGLQTTFTTL